MAVVVGVIEDGDIGGGKKGGRSQSKVGLAEIS